MIIAPPPLRILPLGDSITQGGRADRQEYTYRLPLQRMLRDAGVPFEFVGSMSGGLQADATWPQPFDPRHEGHYGWKTAAVRDALTGWTDKWAAPPDVALIHLGTNDQGSDAATTIVAPLREIIALLRKKNPRVVVLLGHLNFNGGAALQIRPAVTAMARAVSTPESPVRTVDHFEGWTEDPAKPNTDTFDWAHPNPQGQEKMARRWFTAMRPYLRRRA